MNAQVAQLVGAALILLGFVLGQAGRLDQQSRPYLLLNLAGSGILAVLALLGRHWGFVLLEASWTLITLVSLVRGPRKPAA